MDLESARANEDKALLERVALKDQAALACLYDRFSGLMYSAAHFILKEQHLAEDVVQDAFLLIWDRAGQYSPSLGKPVTWIMTLTRNRAIDRLRSIQRRTRLLDQLAEFAVEGHETASEFMDPETAQNIRNALKELPKEQRLAIELAFLQGLTQSEVAAQLGEPLGTVKARIRRGMLALRGKIETPS